MRYATDEILLDAKKYDYNTWTKKVESILDSWKKIEQKAQMLEKNAINYAKMSWGNFIIPDTIAYDHVEITNIFDAAPAWKKITTLARHLNVDAKTAYKILQNTQAQIEADAWNEAWDTFQKLETSATLIKDGCKVIGYIGGIAVAGWPAAIAAGSTITKATIIVSWADLTLEITDDWAKIALGNSNKISSIVTDLRKVTEPLAGILAIQDIPKKIEKSWDILNAVMIWLESLRVSAQEGKILGIQLPVYNWTPVTNDKDIRISVLSKDEVPTWMNDIGTDMDSSDASDWQILSTILKEYVSPEEEENIRENTWAYIEKDMSDSYRPPVAIVTNGIQWRWTGLATYLWATEKDNITSEWIIEFLDNGKVITSMADEDTSPYWTQDGNRVRLYDFEYGVKGGYCEFSLSEAWLRFEKLFTMDEDGVWGEVLAGSEIHWDGTYIGKYAEIILKKIK